MSGSYPIWEPHGFESVGNVNQILLLTIKRRNPVYITHDSEVPDGHPCIEMMYVHTEL